MKHLNPRQGITTLDVHVSSFLRRPAGVKHLNPRQGITTFGVGKRDSIYIELLCETPKSPPGDYNLVHNKPTVCCAVEV